jgi:hypothetical protein
MGRSFDIMMAKRTIAKGTPIATNNAIDAIITVTAISFIRFNIVPSFHSLSYKITPLGRGRTRDFRE